MFIKKALLIAGVGFLWLSCSVIEKNTSSNKKKSAAISDNITKNDDVSARDTSKKTQPRSYRDIITSKAITSVGLFKIHKVEDRYFFEIPDSILDRDILIVNRIGKAAAYIRPDKGYSGYGGDEINQLQVHFAKGTKNKLFLIADAYAERSSDSSLVQSVRNSNVEPIVASFDIKAFSPDSGGVVVDMTDYINSDNSCFSFEPTRKEVFGLGSLQADKSYVQYVKSFPLNIEIGMVKTYSYLRGKYNATYELNSSLVILPKEVMKSRMNDNRVGYFTEAYLDFGKRFSRAMDPRTQVITRWRLEPKAEDVEKYLRGELVEPKKPIVYYIDPATPKKWVPYLIQGVNVWQQAFEKAGFKHAIYALEAPVNDSSWSLYDARHSAIIYKSSMVPNASGPHIRDPRSGEILETHINWYHRVMDLLHDWYFVQASPNDVRARKMEFDDSLMGRLIEFVAAHEVGHTLGLTHNMGASSTIPVEKLRDKKWVEANGFCPSIMDYARFNYVAQPEDSVGEKGIFPRIGVYDEWAIEWGYRWFPAFKSEKAERAYMSQWVTDRLSKDKRLWYGREYIQDDPRIRTEDVGDNAMKAGYYGIKNLQRVMSHLIEWTKEPYEEGYHSLADMRQEILKQYRRYLLHAAANIGGMEWVLKTAEEKGHQLQFTSRERQEEAVQFLQEQLFLTPEWIMNKEIFHMVGGYGMYDPIKLQSEVLLKIMTPDIFAALSYPENYKSGSSYTFSELLKDLQEGIFRELKTGVGIDMYRRNLQKVYLEQLIRLFQFNANNREVNFNMTTDLISVLKADIHALLGELNRALPGYKDETIRWHLIDMRERLKKALDDSKNSVSKEDAPKAKTTIDAVKECTIIRNSENRCKDCWDE